MVAGLSSQLAVARLQYKVPLQRSPSSCTAQSALLVHLQFAPATPSLQTPPAHLSSVHASPSTSQAMPSAAGFGPHAPVALSHSVFTHGPSAHGAQSTLEPSAILQLLSAASQ